MLAMIFSTLISDYCYFLQCTNTADQACTHPDVDGLDVADARQLFARPRALGGQCQHRQ